MGRGYVSATFMRDLRSSANLMVVLREIEEEDSLWHRKDKKDSAQDQKGTDTESSKVQVKESVATPSAEETKTQSQGPRKTRFF